MNLLAVLFALSLGTAQAIPADLLCNDLLSMRPLSRLLADIAQNKLDQEISVDIRVWADGQSDARAEFNQLGRLLKLTGYRVELDFSNLRPVDDRSEVEFTIVGRGREVAQALLEISNPTVGGSFAVNPIYWLVRRPAPPPTFLPVERPQGDELAKLLRRPIRDLGLPFYVRRGLTSNGILFVGDLVNQPRLRLMDFRTLGARAVEKTENSLSTLGLQLDMSLPDWPPKDLSRLEVALATVHSRKIDLPSWLQEPTNRANPLFALPGLGLDVTRPMLAITDVKTGREEVQPLFVLVSRQYFATEQLREIERELRYTVRFSSRDLDPGMFVKIIRWRENLNRMEVRPITDIMGPTGEAQLNKIRATGNPILVVPQVRDATQISSGILVIPL